jgi:hypothetical protein
LDEATDAVQTEIHQPDLAPLGRLHPRLLASIEFNEEWVGGSRQVVWIRQLMRRQCHSSKQLG